jgi:pyruvate/2-oxoglutarate dehydrogenase complex dihydrolipoamide dehydrogenase (E3) component
MKADLCILGGGAAGLSLAAGAAQMGARTILVERGEMGGDCLNTGCVPSKALLAAAALAAAQRQGGFGIAPQAPQVDFAAVMAHVRAAIARIAPHDSVERFERLGVRVIRASGRFTGPQSLAAGGEIITARRFALATGAAPVIPDLPGLEGALTTETLWSLTTLPAHLVIWGGGAVAAELAQAFRRLGSEVTLVTRSGLLSREDPEAVAVLQAALLAEGVRILQAQPDRAVPGGLAWEGGGVQGSHLLLALGRRPRLDFAPEAAGIAVGPQGVQSDARLRTSNPKVFALGDVAGQGQFTHLAGYQAGIVLRQAVLGLPAKVGAAIPRTVWTTPELAQIGRPAGPGDAVLRVDLASLDRGVTEGAQGFAKVVLAKGRVVGVTLIGPGAGEQIALWALVLAAKVRPATLAGLVLPYPALAEHAKRAMGNYFSPRLFENRLLKLIVRAVQRLVP